MKRLSGLTSFLTAVGLAIFAASVPVRAQGNAAVHGQVLNPAGMPQKSGDVKLTLDKGKSAKDQTYKYTFAIDAATGSYKGKDIAPGEYMAVVIDSGKMLDYQDLSVKTGDDKTLDFDMSRAEYLKTMSAEDRKALEEYKKKNAAVSADNAKIQNINKTLLQARDDEKNGKAADAVASLQGVIALKPDEAIIWASLGEAQLALADANMKAAKAAHSPTNDPALLQTYTDAATSYKKAIELNATAKKQTPENLAAYQLNLGQALAKSGDLPNASAAYEASAKASPTMAGSAYFNEAAVMFNASKMDEAAAAADKAIAADPKKADAYYIKAQALIPKATADPKTGKFVLPPGCLESYQEYLELAPDGAHAKEVKELLDNLGQPVKNSFKAGKKP